jgi:colicin import membrane protein
MDDLLRDAIADAKAVRETALANAKIALEEAFTPRLQSMLSKKIAAEMEDKDEEEDSEEMREEEDSEEGKHDADEEKHDSEEMRHDAEEMRHDAEEMRHDAEEMRHDAEEAAHDKEEMGHDAEEMAHDKEEEEDSEEMREEEDAEEGEDEEEGMREEEDAEEDDELDLESVLAELEADLSEEEDKDEEDKVDEAEDKEEEEKVDENDVSSDIGKSDNKVNPEANDSSKTGAQGPEGEGKDEPAGNELDDHDVVKEEEDKDEEDLDLDEVLKALSEEEDAEEEADKVDELKKEIKETREVVKFMRAKLNEVNLLNAKLLFSNKLFRAFGLNNDQKLKVVENFDRTTNLREVKLVYATLAESFQKPSKLSESVKKGSSSKPVASTKPSNKEVLSEGAELKARFKKLANIL